MPTKLSEKKLAIGLVLVVVGVVIFFKTSLITTPVLISEKAIVYVFIAAMFVVFGVLAFKRAAKG